MTRHSDLSSPRQIRRVGLHYDREAFGQFSEGIARTLGTARFLVWQSLVIGMWLGFNYLAPVHGAGRSPSSRSTGSVAGGVAASAASTGGQSK